MRPTPFGELLTMHRIQNGLSVRDLSVKIDVTTVGIGDVERGKRYMLGREYWPALLQALPTLTMDGLEKAAMMSTVHGVRPFDFDGERRELAARLARTSVNLPDLSLDEVRRLISALEEK